MEENILDKIIKAKDVLPKKQRALCNYLAINYVNASIMTVAQLAEDSGVGTTTVMRLVRQLGYDSYSEFRRELMNISLLRNASSYIGIKQGVRTAADPVGTDHLNALWINTTQTIENFITPKNIQQVSAAIPQMIQAKTINLLGLRSSKTAAIYMETMIDRFCYKIRQLSHLTDFLLDRASRLTPEDVLVVFSAWPCTKRTVDVCSICHAEGVPIILITNTSLNPIARYADIVIDTNSVNSGCGILPLLFIAEALISGLAGQLGDEASENLERLEHFLDQTDVFQR